MRFQKIIFNTLLFLYFSVYQIADENGKEVVDTMIKTADWGYQRRYLIDHLDEPFQRSDGTYYTLRDMHYD